MTNYDGFVKFAGIYTLEYHSPLFPQVCGAGRATLSGQSVKPNQRDNIRILYTHHPPLSWIVLKGGRKSFDLFYIVTCSLILLSRNTDI